MSKRCWFDSYIVTFNWEMCTGLFLKSTEVLLTWQALVLFARTRALTLARWWQRCWPTLRNSRWSRGSDQGQLCSPHTPFPPEVRWIRPASWWSSYNRKHHPLETTQQKQLLTSSLWRPARELRGLLLERKTSQRCELVPSGMNWDCMKRFKKKYFNEHKQSATSGFYKCKLTPLHFTEISPPASLWYH